MIVKMSGDAESDVAEGFWFYERQQHGLGDYFRSCILADIDTLAELGGIHETAYGYQRMLTRRFPFVIYYQVESDTVIVVAVLDARRDPSWVKRRLA